MRVHLGIAIVPCKLGEDLGEGWGLAVLAGVSVDELHSNWRDEQRAWRETVGLLDQSHHITDLTIDGPDMRRLLADLGVNSVENFSTQRAKQFVACNEDGYLIGEAVMYSMAENQASFLARPSLPNWVHFHAETGGYDVEIIRDDQTAFNPTGKRRFYRYQLQGPRTWDLLEAVAGGPIEKPKFFHTTTITLAGHKVWALGHGMAGTAGLEFWGPWEEGADVKAALIEAGKQFELRQVGAMAYPTNAVESGWVPNPLPAIYDGEQTRAYREWLSAKSFDAAGSLGGSFYSENITDYYLTPFDLGYGSFIKYDHDFIGRDALQKLSAEPPRRKVTLAWNGDDVTRALGSYFHPGDRAKFISLPLSNYSTWQVDQVLLDGRPVGVSTFSGYSSNERTMLSLAAIDVDVPIGAEVTLVWGDADPNVSRPTVEPHVLTEIRAIVSPVPYAEVARTEYAQGTWRTAATD